YRNVVNHRRDETQEYVHRGRIPVAVKLVRHQFQIAHVPQTANTHHHTVEKQQRVPLGTGNTVEYIERYHATEATQCFLIALLLGQRALALQRTRQGLAQEVTEELQVTQTGHHAEY